MKRVMVFSLAGLLVLALVGLVFAESWDLRCEPGEMESTAVNGESGYGQLRHKIESATDDGANSVPHGGWIYDGDDQLFAYVVELVYQETDITYANISLGTGIWSVHVNDNGTGYSDFTLTYPY